MTGARFSPAAARAMTDKGETSEVGGLGCGLSVVTFFFALIGLIPLFGWLNWITTLPLAVLTIIFSGIAVSRGERGAIPALALVAGVIIFFWAIFRLAIGGGFF